MKKEEPDDGLFSCCRPFAANQHCYRRMTPASCRTPIDSITTINPAANMRYAAIPFESDFESVTAHTPFFVLRMCR